MLVPRRYTPSYRALPLCVCVVGGGLNMCDGGRDVCVGGKMYQGEMCMCKQLSVLCFL